MKAGWELKTLGDICGFQNGFAFKSNKFSASGTPILRISNIQDESIETRRVVYIQPEDYKENLDRYRVVKGDLLIAMSGATTGKIGFNETDQLYYLNQRVGKFEPKNILSKKFLFYFLSTRVEENLIISAGSAQPNLSTEQIKDFQIPLPQLAEQKRIVAILDKAFENIAIAKANAERNLKNARELFESYLQSVFTKSSEGLVPLSELATDITDGDHMPPPKSSSGVPFITISNINKNTRKIDFSDTYTVSIEYFKKLKPNRKPTKGDVLYTVTGSFGIPVIVDSDFEFCFQRHIGLIRPTNETDSRWLYYLMLSPSVFKQADEGATGTAQKTVSLKVLRNLLVPKMPLAEQKTIVKKLDALSIETQYLESIYQQKIAALDELKKSLLHKAFSGELTADFVENSKP